mmetsp:Transcript_1842/g.6524  ORF Transcript_1842/g.6524 Transcript_1842/m.6524 type:complete len:292 (-) Transcript_1842:298-1173(-)|eukprot:CAMPEP_0117442830 /NCGR_PEP_ID=MMETSP0759-20121206/4364_1 /TAXON_ID=63605 /ORGANISM="Percolomonas cosmopolitus, Strain WS" /LENGTH=291 /DNA_ID=CAMNT_0005234751 /DNA_START=268 /DNA_END=1143 /DNA_ORIENTATION=-
MGNTTTKGTDNNAPITRSESTTSSEDERDYYPRDKTQFVSLMLVWPYGGRKVSIIGSFNGWREAIPMNYNDEDKCFLVVLTVPGGKHQYRFLVDGVNRTDPKQRTERDDKGELVNVIELKTGMTNHDEEDVQEGINRAELDDDIGADLTAKTPPMHTPKKPITIPTASSAPTTPRSPPKTASPKHASELEEYKEGRRKAKILGGEWGQFEQEFVVTRKVPPNLPPHLKYSSVLNQKKHHMVPVPLHVTVNHVYFSNLKDEVDIMGISQRYKQKFTTIAMFKPTKHSPSTTE